jgi:hypothetical protein
MWAEASGHRAADHAAIAHAVGRWSAVTGRSYETQLVLSCHGLRNGAARVDRETAADPEQWAKVQARAAAYFAGNLPNPCPGAAHWGGMSLASDRARIEARVAAGTWEVVRCKAPTANTFVREVKR